MVQLADGLVVRAQPEMRDAYRGVQLQAVAVAILVAECILAGAEVD